MSFGYGFGPRARRRGVIAGGGGGEPPPPSFDVQFVGVETTAYSDVSQHTVTVPSGAAAGDELVLVLTGSVTDDPVTPLAAFPAPPSGWNLHTRSYFTGGGSSWQRQLRQSAPETVPSTVVVGEAEADYRGPWMAALLVYRNGRLTGGGPTRTSGPNWLAGATNTALPLDCSDGLALDIVTTADVGNPSLSTSPSVTRRIDLSRLLAGERDGSFGALSVTADETTQRGLLHRFNVVPNSVMGNVQHSGFRLPVVAGQLGVIVRHSRGSSPATPEGWTRVVNVDSGSTSNLHVQTRVFVKVMDGSEDASLLFARSDLQETCYFAIDTDADEGDVVAASTSESLVAPSVEATGEGLLLTMTNRRAGEFPAGSAPAGTSAALQETSLNVGMDGCMVVIERVESGTTGVRTFTSSGGHASRFVSATVFLPDAGE